MKFGKTSKKKVFKVGNLRRSQIISGSGSGAIVDMAKESVIIAGTDFWKNYKYEEYQVFEDNLQKYLGVDYFVTPSVKKSEEKDEADLPAFRFPNWMFCPDCRRLAHEKTFAFNDHPRCKKCNKELIPSRFVVACEKGHLDEFPYEWWVHEGQGKKCSGKPELYFETNDNSSGLESIIIRCKTCKTDRTMAKSFSSETRFKCFGRRPWLNDRDPEECVNKTRTLQRGATNLYFAINASALSIPPWSQEIQIELGYKWSTLSNLLQDQTLFMNVVESIGLDRKCNCDSEYIYEQALMKKRQQDTGTVKTWKDILEDEYRAFLKRDSDNGEFKTRTEEVPNILKGYIDSVVLASKLREVLALRGFKRIDPNFDETDTETFNKVSKGYMNWLPGMELKGEGIFIKLNDSRVKEWEETYGYRYANMAERMGRSLFKKQNFSPRYVLLHSLAHLLMRELILQCGYSTAAIKERIYSSFVDEEQHLEMAGILLYTATNDSEGSLGGLVRQGEMERFEKTFLQMLESASWCSADPLCIHSKAQGVDSLNYAACHSCTLLPETSCEARNCYLDRAAVVGTLDNGSIGFFRHIMDRNNLEESYE